MKANELMIGDWVHCTKLDYAPENYVANMQVKQLYVADLDTYSFKKLKYDEIEPIPLTAEILNKNSFETNGNGIFAAYCPEDMHANLEISEHYHYDNEKIEGGFYWTINCCEYDIIRLRYVHELQHALKLCGIDKTIEL